MEELLQCCWQWLEWAFILKALLCTHLSIASCEPYKSRTKNASWCILKAFSCKKQKVIQAHKLGNKIESSVFWPKRDQPIYEPQKRVNNLSNKKEFTKLQDICTNTRNPLKHYPLALCLQHTMMKLSSKIDTDYSYGTILKPVNLLWASDLQKVLHNATNKKSRLWGLMVTWSGVLTKLKSFTLLWLVQKQKQSDTPAKKAFKKYEWIEHIRIEQNMLKKTLKL